MGHVSNVRKNLVTLAVFGGAPRFGEPLHVGRPNIGSRLSFLRRIEEMLDRRWLTNNGPFVQELEATLASILGVEHCVAVCNATVGLEITARALGLAGEVIVPSFTFVATAHAFRWLGLAPVFCDIDRSTHNLNASEVGTLVTERTGAIVATHLWGRPADIAGLQAVAEHHGLRLIFDAAHALGVSAAGRMVGGFGDAEVFSLHATKFINSFEGGVVTTRDGDLAARIRLMRNFGFAGLDSVVSEGTNGKMSEVCAAMALTTLEAREEIVRCSGENYGRYQEALAGIEGLCILPFDTRERNNYQYVVVEVDGERTGLSRDEILAVLHKENVLARRYFYPGCHRMEPYLSEGAGIRGCLAATEEVAARVLVLPTGTTVGQTDVDAVCCVIREAVARRDEVRHVLRKAAGRG
jgi:dTDP-4-amino-4,6-dideoxygalactose transaminase